MSASRPRLVVHLGQHKTGSKALQSFLACHAARLRARGVLYPLSAPDVIRDRAFAISHFHFFARLRHEVMTAGGETAAAARFWTEHGPVCPPFTSLRAVFAAMDAERVQAKADTLLLSAEDLFDLHTSHELGFAIARVRRAAAQLADLAREFGYAPRLVVYLRRPDHLLAAHYAQFIKGPGDADLEFDAFAAAFAPRLRALDLLEIWSGVFGDDALTVRVHEPAQLPHGIVADFFPHALGFAVPTDWPAPPRDRESVNASPGRDELEFIRRLKRGEVPGGADLTVADVLDGSLAAAAADPGGRGAAAWLAPAARRALLEDQAADHARIAQRFLAGRPSLFTEAAPADDAAWRPYREPGAGAWRRMARRFAARVGWRERWRRRIGRWRQRWRERRRPGRMIASRP